MTSNLYQKSLQANIGYTPLSDTPLVLDVTIIASSKNNSSVNVRFTSQGAGGLQLIDASWPPGAIVSLRNVDLSKILVSGTLGNYLLVVGQAP